MFPISALFPAEIHTVIISNIEKAMLTCCAIFGAVEHQKRWRKKKEGRCLSFFLNNCSSGMLSTSSGVLMKTQGSAVSCASSWDLQDMFISSALLPPEVHTMYSIARGPLLTVTPPNIMQCNGSLSVARFSIFKKRSLYPNNAYVMTGVLLTTKGSAVSSVKLFGWTL